MKRTLRVVLAVFFLAQCATDAFACSCADPSVREKFRAADAIFLGRVVEMNPFEPNKDFPLGMYLVRFEVERRWKGDVGREVTAVADFDSPGMCGDFRGNIPYFDFADFEEAIREACGKRETNRFEPSAGKGAVARATFYFLLRYPGEINAVDSEYPPERLKILLKWHTTNPVSQYERHRNQAIFAAQGNRNPLIDFPQWAKKIDFKRGLGG